MWSDQKARSVAPPTLAEEAAAARELILRGGLHEFVRWFWHAAGEASTFVDGWHLGAVCEFLQAITLREIRRGVINVPPGTGKTLTTQVFWPAWQWSFQPQHRWLFLSYELRLVLSAAQQCLNVCESDLYRAAWPRAELRDGRQPVGDYKTKAGGARLSRQLGGGVTGHHANTVVCDDPTKPDAAEAVSGVQLETVSRIWSNTIATRRADPRTHAELIIMQRIHENDLAGEMLREQGYEHLCLPMRYVPRCEWDMGCTLGKLDQRTRPGELLFPERFPESVVHELEIALDTPQNISAQLQQNPVPKTGAFFEDAWFQTWEELPARVRVVQSWDLGFKGKTKARARQATSRVHGALWAFTDRAYYLLDERIGWWNYPETERQFLKVQEVEAWANAECILVEDKANGPALIATLKEKRPGLRIKPVEPSGSKEDRAARHSALVEAGQVWLPSRAILPSVGDFRAELVRFPNQRQNDRVDTTTQALDYMHGKTRRIANALQALRRNR